jgi:membrane protease YdiL (CAAX protease family)
MKSFLKTLAIVLGALLLSAFLAPLLVQFLPFKFEKIFNRLIMIFTLLAAAFFVRLDFKKIKTYGLTWTAGSRFQILAGFLGGVLILSLLTLVKIKAGMAYWDISGLHAGTWIYKYIVIVLTAFLIGMIEEFFFRGVIYRSLKEKAGWSLFCAVLLTSIFYSLVHFVNIEKPYIDATPTFWDSLKLIAAPFKSFLNWREYWRGAAGLFLFGVILNLLAIRSKSLWISIGLHAGCVFFVKMDGHYVEFLNNSPLLWGSGKMYDSAAGWIALILLGFGLWPMAKPFKESAS